MASNPTSALTLGIKEIYASGIFSDLTITCRSKQFKVHKLILYTQSTYFKTLLGGRFKESQGSTIDFPDDDPDVMAALIHFLYTFAFEESLRGEHSLLSFCVYVYAAADKYGLPALQAQAVGKFKLKCDPSRDVESFVEAIHAVEQNTSQNDRTLWNVVVPIIRTNITTLLAKPEFQQLMRDLPALNFELLGMLDDRSSAAKGMGLGLPIYTPQPPAPQVESGAPGPDEEAEDDLDDEMGDDGFGPFGNVRSQTRGAGWRGRGGFHGGGRRLGD